MKVLMKSLDVEMKIKSRGVEFEVRSPDSSEFLGDCYLTMTGITWCKGRTDKKNGEKITWNDFIVLMSDRTTRDAAIKQAKRNQKEQ